MMPGDLPADLRTTARCIVCDGLTPEADAAFCGDACTAARTDDAVAVVEALEAESRLAALAERAIVEARTTGVWN
jgi:hypothetical protein